MIGMVWNQFSKAGSSKSSFPEVQPKLCKTDEPQGFHKDPPFQMCWESLPDHFPSFLNDFNMFSISVSRDGYTNQRNTRIILMFLISPLRDGLLSLQGMALGFYEAGTHMAVLEAAAQGP